MRAETEGLFEGWYLGGISTIDDVAKESKSRGSKVFIFIWKKSLLESLMEE